MPVIVASLRPSRLCMLLCFPTGKDLASKQSQVFKRLLHERAGHLLAPVHKKVSIVERASLDVARLSGGVNSLLIEPFSNERLLGLAYLNGSRCDSSEYQPGTAYGSVIRHIERDRHAKDWKIERA